MRILTVAVVCCLLLGCDSTERSEVGAQTAASDSGSTDYLFYEDTVPACARCRISATEVAAFGSLGDSILFRGVPVLARNSRGDFFAAVPFAARQEITQHSPSGVFKGVVGRYGEGPGEFKYVNDLSVGPLDSIYIAHDGNRVTVFDPQGTPARSTGPMGAVLDRILPVRGGIIANASVRTPQISGVPLHWVDGRGEYRYSFGEKSIRGAYGVTDRVLATSRGGDLWVAEPGLYRIEKISLRGESKALLGVGAPGSWFTRTMMTAAQEEEEMESAALVRVTASGVDMSSFPPAFRVSGIYEGADGRLFVSTNSAVPDWESRPLEYDEGEGRERSKTLASEHARYRTFVDVLDVVSGKVLARREFPGKGWILQDGTLVLPEIDELGVISIRAYELAFEEVG